MLTRKPQPVHGIKKKVQVIYDLICQRNLKLAQTELTKLMKKQKSKCPPLEALQVFINVLVHKNVSAIQDLEQLTEFLNTGEEDDQTVHVVASSYRYLGRCDKAAEVFMIYAERFDRVLYVENSYEHYVRGLNLDEQMKFAMKLKKTDPTSRHRLCTSSFVLAAFKKTPKERNMGMKFASMLAKRLFSDDLEFLADFDETIEEFEASIVSRKNQRMFWDSDSKTWAVRFKSPTETESAMRINLNLSLHRDFPLEHCDEKEEDFAKAFAENFDSLLGGERDWNTWEDVIQQAIRMKVFNGTDDGMHQLVDLFKTLVVDQDADKDSLLAAMKFVHFTCTDVTSSTLDFFLDTFVRKYGFYPDAIQQILPYFLNLNDFGQEAILQTNSKYLQKESESLGAWFNRGVTKKPTVEERNDILEQLLKESGPDAVDFTGIQMIRYYQRLLLDEVLNNYKCKGHFVVSVIQKRIDFWNNAIEFLDLMTAQSRISIDALVTVITRQCAQYFWWLYNNLNNQIYLEALACFLIKQGHRTETLSQVVQLLLAQSYFELGNASPITTLFDEMQLRPLQYQSMGYFLDSYLQNAGRFDDALKEHDAMNRRYFCYSFEMQDNLIQACSEGRAGQALEIAIMIHESKNLLQRAVHYSRRQFLELILRTKTYSQLNDAFLRDGWPERHPFDHRDCQIFLQNLPYQDTATAAFTQMQSYCFNICEIHVIRVLMEAVLVMSEDVVENISSSLGKMNDLLTFYMDFVKKVDENINPTLSMKVNNLRDPVFVLFADLVKHCLCRLSRVTPNKVDLECLPSVLYFQRVFNKIGDVLLSVFRQKNNYGRQIQTLATTIQLTQYMSHFISVMFKFIAGVLYTTTDQMRTNKKLKAVYDCFRRFGIEIRAMLDFVESLSKKLGVRIAQHNHAIPLPNEGDDAIKRAVTEFLKATISDHGDSLTALKKCMCSDYLIKTGLTE